jgi:hypothetical protein
MIRILHISDLHLEKEELSNPKRNIIDALIEDIGNFINDNTIFIFTGDLVDKGGIGFSDRDLAFNNFENLFITPILTKYETLKGKVFLVPGNHDIFRDKIDGITEQGLKASLVDSIETNNFIEQNRSSYKHLERLEDYKKWEKDFYAKYNPDANVSNFENTFKLEIKENTVGITCLNSSWLCKDDSDKNNLLLGKNQIENSLKEIQSCQIKLAVMHHPLEFFKDFDKEESQNLLYSQYDALFTGHVHKLSSSYTQDLFGNIFISIANSSIGDHPKEREYVNGYTIVDLYPNEKIEVHYRKYIEVKNCFVPNTDMGIESGKTTFYIPKKEEFLQFEKNKRILDSIKNRFFEKLNDDIIISSSNTNVECSIDNLFIEPRILNNPQDNLSEKDTKEYSIESILSSSENFLIYGAKEAGKTLLLDKMFIESVEKFNRYNKIPILVKFNDFKKRKIQQVIREFLSVSSNEIDNFLSENQIILFIDDILFSTTPQNQIESLIELIEKYPKLQIVGTANLLLENHIPIDSFDYHKIFKFNISFIQSFGSKEIKQLIQKWYANKEVDLQENMQKLIKSFTDFGLPRTPLSVTLFLWIFEKQEKKPINNSVLVELFIENLLEKTNIENVYSDTFDFTNKKRLLSFTAYHMYEKGDADANYAISYADLVKYFETYLKSRLPGKPQKILDDFIKRGIFSEEGNNTIRFKSAFFFHYFLALHFDYSPEFKQFVFEGDNYLNFTDEITYYTGLKRDDTEILKFTQQKLNEIFGMFNEDVMNNYEKVDKVLESKRDNTITFQIDDKKAQTKLTEKQIEEIYDTSLSSIPVSKTIEKKELNKKTSDYQIDKVLKLASNVLKNSEDVDDFELKKKSYSNILTSSISFLMQYRDYLISYYIKYKKEPNHFPKNVDFHLFIKIIPMIHQVVIYDWLGTQKLRPVIVDKIEKDKESLNISDYERFLSVFIYGDIKGSDYPIYIEDFIKKIRYNYLKDLSYLKIMSYFHLRKNDSMLDEKYIRIMADIKQKLGHLDVSKKSKFMQNLKDDKKKNNLD